MGLLDTNPFNIETNYRRPADENINDYRRAPDPAFSDFRRPSRQIVDEFIAGQTNSQPVITPERMLPSLFSGGWGTGNNQGYQMQPVKNNFSYNAQPFNYNAQPFEYSAQPFNYNQQPFNFQPSEQQGFDYTSPSLGFTKV